MRSATTTTIAWWIVALVSAGCSSGRPAATRAHDLSVPAPFSAALAQGRFTDARAEVERLRAEGRLAAALRAQARLAKRVHDRALIAAVAADPHVSLVQEDAAAAAELSRAVLWTAGHAEASALLGAVCADARLPAGSRDRQSACSHGALGALSRERPRAFEGEARTSVDLLTKIPLPIVLASVNGKQPEPFIVDTGAATSVLSKAYCDRAGIPYLADKPHVSDSPGGPVTLYPALVDEIRLGALTVKNWTAQVIQLPPNLKVGGILAPHDTLRGALVELDGRELKLRVYRDLDEKGWRELVGEPVWAEPLVWGDGNYYLRATVDGALKGYFLFDTGAGACTLTPGGAAGLGVAPDESAEKQSVTAGAASKVYQKVERPLAVGDSPPRREELVVVAEVEPDEVVRVGSIGFPWTLGRRMALTPDGATLLFTGSAGR